MKKIFLAVAIMAAAGILSGCGGNGGQKAVEITVVSPFDSEDGNRSHFVNAYQAYEKATGNIVRDEAAASNEEWKAKVLEDFQAGKEPDVLFYFTGTDADELVQSGKLVPL
ncbi:MAG: ABC transporter substrate-binding protein, partial [Clostridia bacterium]|nr:ABC transporter substrate-binding protein [Clostridia bacterium]